MNKLRIHRTDRGRWLMWVVPENGYEGIADSIYRDSRGYYHNDHNSTVFLTFWEMAEYLLRNF